MTPQASPNDAFSRSFGFAPVREEEKQARVNEVFTGVAARYDLMNDAMSGGLHRAWKDHLIARLRPTPAMRLLDVAGGTGDVALRFLKAGGGAVTICDINAAMIERGRAKMVDGGAFSLFAGEKSGRVAWAQGDAEALPFREGTFDAYAIAFGLRNVTHIAAALGEAWRALRPGGRFLCLEFSRPGDLLAPLYDRYSFSVIPRLGGWIAGDEAAYRYLVESIRRFPDQKTLEVMLRDAGFARVRHTNLAGGIVALHEGWKT